LRLNGTGSYLADPRRMMKFHNYFRGLIDDLRGENRLMHRTITNR
jgi:hypothetical protein